MTVLSKCSKCRRTYTTSMTICQMCGAPCVPASQEDHVVVKPQSQADLPVIGAKKVCPCCGGAPGTGTVSLTTHKQLTTNLIEDIRGQRKYRVTTITIPGVCDDCSSSLTKRRILADVLCVLPLIPLFAILVIADNGVFAVFILLYLIYMASRLTYNWADQMLYGANLERSIGRYAPQGEFGTIQFSAGILHGLARILVLPGLMIGLAILAHLAIAVKTVVAANSPSGTSAATDDPDDDIVVDQNLSHQDQLLTYLDKAKKICVIVTPETAAHPESVLPKLRDQEISARTWKVGDGYAKESLVPPNSDYVTMDGATFINRFLKTNGKFIWIHGGEFLVTRTEAEKAAPLLNNLGKVPSVLKHSVPNTPPKPIE